MNGTTDSAGADAGGLHQGHVVSNGSIVVNGGGLIDGNATAGPGKSVVLNGTGSVTGTRTSAATAASCSPIDLVALAADLRTRNDNARIPLTASGRNVLGGSSGADFKLNAGDSLTLPAGTYYFTSFTVNGGATLAIGGPVRILCTGDASFNGNTNMGGSRTPLDLLFFTSGTDLKILSGVSVAGFFYAPGAQANLGSGGRIIGGLFAGSATINGGGRVTRQGNLTPLSVSIAEPANGSTPADPSAVLVRGAATGAAGGVTLTVNGATVPVSGTGTFAATLDMRSVVPPVITVNATDSVGQTATAAVTLQVGADTRQPTLTLDAPALAPGACLPAGTPIAVSGKLVDSGAAGSGARDVTLTVTAPGAAARASTATFDVSGRVWSVPNVDVGSADGTLLLSAVGTDAAGRTARLVRSFRVDASIPAVVLLLDGAVFPGSAAGAAPGPGETSTLFNRALLPRAAVTDSPDAAPPPAVLTLDGAPYALGTPITAEGTHLLVARAVDCANHQGAAHVSFTLDLTPPRLLSTSPADGATVGSAPPAYSGASDPDLATASVNGIPAAVSSGTFTLSPFAWKEGSNTVTIELADRAGNRATYARAFTARTLGPSLEILESGLPLASGTTFFRSVVPVIRSGNPAATIAATLNGQPFASGTPVTSAGDYALAASATDALGHSATANASFKIDLSAPPTIDITSPPEGATVTGPTLAVAGTAGASVVKVTVNGRAAALSGTSWTLADLRLENDVVNDIVAVGSDAAGRSATATRQVMVRSSGPQVLILDPPDGFTTNRRKIDVAGAVVGGPSATADGKAVVAGQTLSLDPLGNFRAVDVPLADGPNTITASATDPQGRTGQASVHVTSDATIPAIALLADGQELAEGASFLKPFTLRVAVTKPSGTPPIPSIRLNGQQRTATSAVTDIPITENGGYVVSVVARDAAGNESRADRGFTLSLGGCAITELDPPDGSTVAAPAVTIRGRSGDARSITLRVPNPGTSPVTYQSFPAPLADGTFALGDVALAVGENLLQIDCTDRGGAVKTVPLKLTRLASGAGPVVVITSPAAGGKQTGATVAVSGTVSDASASVTVNGLPATVTPSPAGDGTFSFATAPLAEGPNVLSARALDRAGRTGDDRVVFFRDSTAPKVQITSPVNGAHAGRRGSGPAAVDVTGLVDLTTEPNLSSVVVATAAGSVTAVVDSATGAFSATGVPLSSSSPDTAQAVTATATDALGLTGTSTVSVFFDAAGPALKLSQPADLTRYSETSPAAVPVTGEAWAADGAQVSVNGGGLDPSTLAWEPAAADGRRHTTFSTSIALPSTDGAFGIVAVVEEPGGKFANDKRLLFRDGAAPTVLEMLPPDGSKTVDTNEILLVLFSEPVLPASLSSADGLTLARLSTSEKVAGLLTQAGNAVAFTPAAALVRGERYTFRAGAGVTDLVGHALATTAQVTFTVALSPSGSAPTLDPIPPVLCATELAVKGSAAPGASLRLRDGSLIFSAVADGTGRFSVTIPLSGNGFHSLRAAAVDRETGASSPETVVLFRVDCSAPSVIAAAFDRTSGRITVTFSEAMKPETLSTGAPPASLRVSDAEDGSRAPQSATLSLSADGTAATLDLGSDAGAWWRSKSVRLEVGPPASDLKGNAMAARYETVFFLGGGDLSGAFLSGEVYDDESGRPLAGADVKLYASGAALPGSVAAASVGSPVASTVTDSRGRFSLVGDVPAGRYALVLSGGGTTRVLRRLALEPAVGAVPFDSRLTPLAAASSSPLNPAAGGSFAGPAGSSLVLEVAPGALSGASLGVKLTPLSGQGLPDLLPLGWTPLAAAEVRLTSGEDPLPEGAGTPFAANSVRLTLPLPSGLSPTVSLFAARYDISSGLWISLAVPEKLTGAQGQALARVTLAGPGSVAVLVADAAPTAPPSLPSAPDTTLLGASLPSPIPALAAQISLDPPIVSPTGRASARVVAHSTDNAALWPSGLAVQAYLDERLILSGGGELYESPFSTDLVLYHSPLTAAEQGSAAAAAAGAMAFRVSPSPRAAQVLLETGWENIRLYPFPDQIERGSVLGPAGGSVTSTDGTELFLPEGALPQKTVVKARLLSTQEMSTVAVPAGFTLVAGVRVDLAGFSLARPATLKINAPASTPVDAAGDPRMILATSVDQPADGRGAFQRLVARASLLPASGGIPARLVAAPEPTGSTLPLSGIDGEGVYLFLHANASIGFATGFVRAESGAGYANSRATAGGLGTADLSRPGGRYAMPAPSGAANLEALHPTSGEKGTAQIPSLGMGQIAAIDIVIHPVAPTVRSLQPPDGATNQPVGTTAAVTFSEPLDATSVSAGTLLLELANADGTGTGLLFNGTVALSSDKLTVVFTSARPLPPARRILARLATAVRDADGTPYAGALPLTWSFTTSTVVVPGGLIHPEKIRLLLPAGGTSQIVGDSGALPTVTSGASWAVWADVDGARTCPSVTTYPANGSGGFTAAAGCPPTVSVTLASRVYLHVIDPTGTEAATFRLGPFVTADGRGFVAQAGEETVFTSADGIQVTAPAAAFQTPTLVTVRKLDPSTLGVPIQSGMELGALLNVDFEGTAAETLRLKIPITTSAPAGRLVFAGSPVDLPWGRRLKILDLGRIIADSSGQKYISTAEADQPASALSIRTQVTRKAAEFPRSNLMQTIAAEFTARATAAFIFGATLELSAVTGHIEPALLGANFFVLFNALADTFVYVPQARNWDGHYVLPTTGSSFSIVKRDVSTGWILTEKTYTGIGSDPTRFVNLGELEPSSTEPPHLVDASPFTLLRFAAPPVAAGSEQTLRIKLEVEAHTTDQARTSLRPIADFPLPDGTFLELYDLKTPAQAQALASGGTFSLPEIATPVGDPLLAVVSPPDLDPEGFAEFSFSFTRPLENTADPSTLVKLTDCGQVEDPITSVGCSGTTKVPMRVSQQDDYFRLSAAPFGSLLHGHRYKLELLGIKSGPNPPDAYPAADPATFVFSTRKGPSTPIGGPATGTLNLIDTNTARDLLKFGNLLMVGSATGKIVAFDVSDPKNQSAIARMDEEPLQVRAFATDGHGRLFFNELLGASWAVKAIRLEDVRAASQPCAGSTLPCFAPATGGVRVAFALGFTSGLTGSEYLDLTGSLPTGTPTDMQVVVDDDRVGPYPLEEFFQKVPGSGPAPGGLPDSSGFYTFAINVNTAPHVYNRTSSACNETLYDTKQRVTIDNLTTGQSWSVDVPGGGAAKAVPGIRARAGDQILVRYNKTAIAYVAIIGSGITTIDVNRFYDTVSPPVPTQQKLGQCGRRLGSYEGAELKLFSECQTPAPPDEASASRLQGISLTPALVAVPGPTDIQVFSVLTHYGAGIFSAGARTPQDLRAAEPRCLKGTVPATSPRPSYRSLAMARGATWLDRGIVAAPDDVYLAPPASFRRAQATGDLLFYSLGSGGVAVFDARYRPALALIGRFSARGHSVFHVATDLPARRLFAGGNNEKGEPIIDVWDIALANGGPSSDGVFPAAEGVEAVDPRLLSTLAAPWTTNHIGFDDATGLLYTWGLDKNANEGGFVLPTGDPQFLFSGLYRSDGNEVDRTAGGPALPSIQVPAQWLVPLGVPLRLSPADEKDATKKREDERKATATFKVRVALPGGLGQTLAAKLQTLRALPESRFLSKDNVGPLTALPGGPGWPERDVVVTLRRLVSNSASADRLQPTYNLYESDETVVLVADPRARVDYKRQDLNDPNQKGDESTQCRRCERPSYLPLVSDPRVKELLAGGPYLRAYLFDDPAADAATRSATRYALSFFEAQKDNYRAPIGTAQVSAFADEVPSAIQMSLSEPAQNPATWDGEAGGGVSLVSGEAILSTTDHAVRGRGLGFAFDRTYRSGVIGYGPLGAAGWSSALLAHLRILPDTKEVEYHDGSGHVWKFSPPDESGNCVAGYEKDSPTSPTYCLPKGLFLKLESVPSGYRLIGRNHDFLLFDFAGRLTRISDRHSRDPKDPDKMGSSLKLFYSGFGQLVKAEDDLGRIYTFRYQDDSLDSGGNPDPKYGLLKEIEDFDKRVVKFDFEALPRRLQSVTLPEVETASGTTSPRINYFYESRTFDDRAPVHGADLSKLHLTGYDLPTSPGVKRAEFVYDSSTGRVTAFNVPQNVSWTLSYTPTSAAPATSASVTAPFGLITQHTLENGRVKVRTHSNLEVASGGPPNSAAISMTFTYHSSDDGRVKVVRRGDGSEWEYFYPDNTGGSSDLLSRANVERMVDRQGGAPGNSAYSEVETGFGGFVDNIPADTTDGEGRHIQDAIPVPDTSAVPSGFPSDSVTGSTSFDKFGRPKSLKNGSGAEAEDLSLEFKSDEKGNSGAGQVSKVTQGPLSTSYDYDKRGNVKEETTSYGTKSSAKYDSWDRPTEETIGASAGNLQDVGAKVTRKFDAAGHLVEEARSQRGVGDVRTTYEYNAREQVTRITRDQRASATPNGGLVSGSTLFTYDGSTGLLTNVTSAGSVATTFGYDTAGRLKNERTGISGERVRGYDPLGRLSYMTDGDSPAGTWVGQYDAWGRLFHEELPTGAVIERTFDKAGGLLRETMADRATPTAYLSDVSAHVKSFGALDRLEQKQTTGQSRTTNVAFDSAGRVKTQDTSGRLDFQAEYESGTGRPTVVRDSVQENRLTYGTDGSLPWPDSIATSEATPGSCSAFSPTTVTTVDKRDAFGRVVDAHTSDGTAVHVDYDELGHPLAIDEGQGGRSSFKWDGGGNLVQATRPDGRGNTSYGYDLDGRPLARQTTATASGTFTTSWIYDPSGRAASTTRPDGTQEFYQYYPDDMLRQVTRRDGAILNYQYDLANRLTKVTPQAGSSGVLADGGQAFTYDAASRLLSNRRLESDGTPTARTLVAFGAYDMAGRPQAETVGARPALSRQYDVFGQTTRLTLPAGVGAASSYSLDRTFQACSNRLVTLKDAGGPGTLGATWAWAGGDHLLGMTTNGPLHVAHRYGYIGGPGAQPPGQPPAVGAWRLGTLTVGTAGSPTADPIAAAGKALGSTDLPGSQPWGQFAYGYRAGDAAKLGRGVIVPPSIGSTAFGGASSSLVSGQGWAWGIDSGKRLKKAYLGRGDLEGVDGARALAGALERFDYEYLAADQLVKAEKEVAGETVDYATAAEGRIDTRTVNGGTPAHFAYDNSGRRTEDDRFRYVWHWFGKLATATVKTGWTSPYENNQVRYEYDSLGRLFSRTHVGPLPAGVTDESQRPFIERREYLWEGDGLVAEAAYAADGTIRWRKTYVPGAKGLDDAVQLRLEIYDSSGATVQSDRLFAYVRDEQNTVLSLVEDKSVPDPAKPTTPVRYFYSPYGEAHSESVLETRRARHDEQLTTVGGSSQSVVAGNAPGGLRLTMGAAVDAATLPTGVLLEKQNTDGTWGALLAAELALQATSDDPAEIQLLPLAGFARGTSYRIRLTPTLKDTLGRSPSALPDLSFAVPTTTGIVFDKNFPLVFETFLAAGDTAAGTFPGGQTSLWQGLWTDPVTGLAYARARWYDPRTQAWLSEDPLEDRDSPNLYGFVSGKPHEKRDPFGLYEADVHYGLTYFLARKAGYEKTDAGIVAGEDEGVDRHLWSSPMALSAKGDWAKVIYYHFPISPKTNKVEEATSREANSVPWARLSAAKDLVDLGEALHLLQDSFSHAKAYKGNLRSQLNLLGPPGFARTLGENDPRGPHIANSKDGIMHAFTKEAVKKYGKEGGAHSVDWTFTDVSKAMRMAKATYDALIDYKVQTGEYSMQQAGEVRAKWPQLEAQLREFAQADTVDKKKAWLARNEPDALQWLPWDDLSLGLAKRK